MPLGFLGVMTHELYQIVPPYLVLAVVLLSAVNAVFYELTERPTVAGQEILDQVEGFKRFLSATEEDRIERLSSKEAQALYERLLPYAIALGMKNRWAANFGDAMSQLIPVNRR